MDVKALQLRHRCDVCDRSFDTQQGLRIHKTRWCTGREGPIRSRKGTRADKLVRRDKCKAIEENRSDKLFLKDGSEVKGTFANSYLGVQLTVEGTSDYEVECRIRKAEAVRNEIRSLLCESRLPLALRVQLLRVRVFSMLLYSAESWDLNDDSLCRTLKHFDRRCMATLLKKEVQFISVEECSMSDPIQAARQLQWNWEGHVERMPLERLPKLCRDVVDYSGWFDRCLLSRANDRREWIELYHHGQQMD